MKSVVKIAAALGISALVLTACGSGGSSSASGEGEKTVELWTALTEGADTSEALKPLLAKWEEETGYKILQSNFNYDMLHDKMIASAGGGNLPDAIWGLPEYVGEFYKMGILADLTDAWENWDQKDNVSDGIKEAMTVDGQIIGFPYETTTRAYLVHDSLFEKAGVSVPETWEDVLAIGSSLEEATGASAYGVAGAGVRAPQELLVYLAQKDLRIAEPQDGGGYRNTWQDEPQQLKAAADVLSFYKGLIDSGAASANSPTYGWEQTDESFATALTASYVTGNWLEEREESNKDTMNDISVHPIPYPKDGKPATYIEAKPLMVMKNSDVLEGATLLSQAFASEEWQQALFSSRSALNTVSDDTKWSRDFHALLDSGVTFPPVSLGEITQNMIDAIAMVLQENKSPEEAATWLAESINASLEKSGDLAK